MRDVIGINFEVAIAPRRVIDRFSIQVGSLAKIALIGNLKSRLAKASEKFGIVL
jgi:hypothetical protein